MSDFVVNIRFSDIDLMGHVNNAVYLTYAESARMHFFQNLAGPYWDWKSQGIILAHAQIDYRLPIHMEDDVIARTSVMHVGKKSIRLKQVFLKQEGNGLTVVFAEVETVMVCFDYPMNRSIDVPEQWRLAFMQLL